MTQIEQNEIPLGNGKTVVEFYRVWEFPAREPEGVTRVREKIPTMTASEHGSLILRGADSLDNISGQR